MLRRLLFCVINAELDYPRCKRGQVMGVYKANKSLAVVEDEVITEVEYQTRVKFRYNGKKQYELSNHLGNVLVTISDRRKAICNEADSTLRYEAVVITASDYYSFGSPLIGRTYQAGSLNGYRYGFNGKEDDDETQTQDYGFRTYNPGLGRFLSVDPLTKDYPYLTPYQFASNSPISGIDLDGLEYYYAADGKFLGQGGDPDNKEVRLGKITGKTKSGNNLITAVDLKGQTQSQWTVIHNNHDDFKAMAGVLYAEADGTTSEAAEEVAGIYSVLENRAKYENTTVKEQMTVAKGVNGASEADKINQADKVGMTAKKEAVFSGLIKGILSETDFSNGAFYWDGKDFNKEANPNGGYKERYVPGFQFTDKSHDLFNQGDNLVKGSNTFKMGGNKTITKSWDYKYQSTGAIGKTTFSKLTDSWRSAQHPSKQAKKVGNGQE